MAKGIVITLGVVLLAGVLILSTALISKNQVSHGSLMSTLSERELILGIDLSIENSLSNFFKKSSNITTKKGSIEISGSFPHTSDLLPYINSLNTMLIESNIPWAVINTTSFESPEIELEDGSIYSQNNNGNSFYINEIDNIDINLKITGYMSGCNYLLEPGDFKFSISVAADNGTCYLSEFIDPDMKNTVDVVTEKAVTNIYLKNRRIYIGNSSYIYTIKVNTNNTALFLKDAYSITKGDMFKSGKVKIN